ncbi:MAG: PP2C family protein-serine/threonine phosphatase [Eubacterium sp.]|nr:PP2C family protein-serine/threonine phosphatase [Eubacterium sp.]
MAEQETKETKETIKTPTKNKKKKKLLVQMGIAIAVVFFFVILVVDLFVVISGRTSYMNTCEDMIRDDLLVAQNASSNGEPIEWTLDYVYEKYDTFMEDVPEASDGDYSFLYDGKTGEYMLEKAGKEDLNALTEEKQHISAASLYMKIAQDLLMATEYMMYQGKEIFLVDISKERAGYFYYYMGQDKSGIVEGGNDYGYQLGAKHPGLEPNARVLEKLQTSDEIQFDSTSAENRDMDGNVTKSEYLVGYLPISVGGEPRLAIGIAYDWTEQTRSQQATYSRLLPAMIFNLLFAAVVLLMLISRKAVRPALVIQKGVREYTDNKDHKAAVKAMHQVKERNELGTLADDFSYLAIEMNLFTRENAELYAEQARADAELEMATNFQRSLLPAESMKTDRFSLQASMNPAREVGGDFYDFFLLDEDHLVILIADVSDKGMGAAFFMAITKTLVKSRAAMGGRPAEILDYVEKILEENNPTSHFVTVWLGIVELTTGNVEICNAGHEYPAICRNGEGYSIRKMPHGSPVAFFPGLPHTASQITLAPGERILLYTDGVTDAKRSDEERFGKERLAEVLNANKDKSDEEILKAVTAAVQSFAGDEPQFDDMTMLSFSFLQKG